MALSAPQEGQGKATKERRKVRKKRKQKQRKEENEEKEAFYSPLGSPAALPPAHQQQQPRLEQQTVRVDLVILPSPLARAPKRGKCVSPVQAVAAAAVAAVSAPAQGVAAMQAAMPYGSTHTAALSNGPASQAAVELVAVKEPEQRKRKRKQESNDGSSKGKMRRNKARKTLTAKGKRAAVLEVLAATELAKATVAAAAGDGDGDVPAAAATAPQQQPQQATVPAAAVVAAVAVAAAPADPAADPAAAANLGRAWSKADISCLARLAEDRAFLLQTIPGHPTEGELDWELISRHFGRYSRGGVAVRQQYGSVMRLMRQARHEGRRGASYVDLVRQALAVLPRRQGTIYEVHAVLKRNHSACLDKYRVKGVLRWKSAVREVLREQPALFEQAGKTATNKIIWRLREAAAA